ncbi:DUF92 domain-containing protein [Mucilaginibacter corticis]|uniref:DUF92 domain-containing protein n=1 Tax=Mucilaginibacter corticis TaxID=2597670 RepID=A0A556MSM0_9SPHI|nr:DUF92 domain-containing protein [Mucilaginibacter corticis]TSJ42940.1 DUF92 domain-containing protein [Mucilaginibacter corticis]
MVVQIIIYTILLLGSTLSYTAKKLTLAGAATGAVVGLLMYKSAGLMGLMILAAFFISAIWATKWQVAKKAAIGAAEENKGRRTAGQVLANGCVAALLGAATWLFPENIAVIKLMIAGSFAAATADTLSSELGIVYGRNFFNILTFKKDQRGLDGVISFEGTLIGVAGASLIALVYSLFMGWSISFLWIILAGFTGNVVDSILGASLERKGWIGNNVVNFLNTAVGAGVCWVLIMF